MNRNLMQMGLIANLILREAFSRGGFSMETFPTSETVYVPYMYSIRSSSVTPMHKSPGSRARKKWKDRRSGRRSNKKR